MPDRVVQSVPGPGADGKTKGARKKGPGKGKKVDGPGGLVDDLVAEGDGEPEAWYRSASLEDVLDELSRYVPSHVSLAEPAHIPRSRFISNLSQEELASPERVCFQIEQA